MTASDPFFQLKTITYPKKSDGHDAYTAAAVREQRQFLRIAGIVNIDENHNNLVPEDAREESYTVLQDLEEVTDQRVFTLVSKYGCTIRYYLYSNETPSAMSVSLSPFNRVIDPEEEDPEFVLKMTTEEAAFHVASEMVVIAYKQGWNKILIADGSYLMRFAAWCAATTHGIEVIGFEDEGHASITQRQQDLADIIKAQHPLVAAQQQTAGISMGMGSSISGSVDEEAED